MAARRMMLPDYGTVSMKGTQYYRTRVTDQQGRRVSLYARTREELYQKEQEAIQQIENKTYRRSTPTVEEYCEKWLLMQSAQIRMTTLIDYTSKVKNYIIKPLGDMHMGDVTADDIRLALLAASKKSASVYKSVNVLYTCIFTAAMESKIIDENPTIYLKKNVGGIPQKERCYYRYEDGKRVKHTVKPVLGQKAAHNGNVVYSLDFEVTPHQLRHTYLSLIHI